MQRRLDEGGRGNRASKLQRDDGGHCRCFIGNCGTENCCVRSGGTLFFFGVLRAHSILARRFEMSAFQGPALLDGNGKWDGWTDGRMDGRGVLRALGRARTGRSFRFVIVF